MDERRYNHKHHPWDDSVYGTGPMEPPKKSGGLLALLLVLVIFLCGIISVLGFLNVRLFRQLSAQQEQSLSISFTTGATQPVEETVPAEIPAPTEESAARLATIDLYQSPEGVENIAAEGGMSLQDIYSRNIDSVVSIACTGNGSSASGTGVIVSSDGYVVTNCHVVEGYANISVQLTDERLFSAQLVGADTVSDLAVLRIAAENLSAAQFGSSESLRVGDSVAAIGDPLGVEFRGTLTNGIVSAINRDVTVDGRTMTLIQTNAALNSGNSGGPLINCYGQVIGINTMKIGTFTSASGVEGLGFAIPSATVKEVVEQLIAQGYVSGRPTLGLTGETLSNFYQHYYRLPAGLYITDVEKGCDAQNKGIQEGDILLSVGESRITSMEELNAAIYEREVGEAVSVQIYRNGQQYRVELVLEEKTN